MSDEGPPAGSSWAPPSCTLPTAVQPLRVAEFDEVFAAAVGAVERVDASRIRVDLLPEPVVAAQVADLVMRETGCCSFFSFTLTATAGSLLLEVAVPPAHRGVLDALGGRITEAAGS